MTHSIFLNNNTKCQQPLSEDLFIFLRAKLRAPLFHIFLFMVGGTGKILPYLDVVCRVTACSQRTLTLEFIFLVFFVVFTIECFVRLEN